MIIAVDLNRGKFVELGIENGGAISTGVSLLFDNAETGLWDAPVYIGRGPYSNYSFMGANRAVAVFFSPLTGGVFVTSAGGVSRALSSAGVDGIYITGRSSHPAVIVLDGDGEGVDAKLFYLNELQELYEEGGSFSLIDFLNDEAGSDFSGYYRVGAVGPAAFGTYFGNVIFYENEMGTFDFFGRGGLGSVLARKNVVGFVIGGTAPEVEVDEKILKLVEETDKAGPTKKYRLVPEEGVGGTIYNWFTLKALLPALNWNTIYMSEREREEIWEDHIKPLTEEIRKRFRGGVIRSKTCGERCVAVCKKMDGGRKVEYEPFTSMGLQTGIFDYEKILSLTHHVDELGLDSIETGNVIALYFDAVDQGVVEGSGSLVNFDPERNYEAALELLERLSRGELPLSEGLARGARQMEIMELAVYVPTKHGGIVPPQYWNPGFHLDLPLFGKFMTNYHNDNLEGREWGRKAGERFLKELLLEDLGICRFHRGWIEKLLESIGITPHYLEDTILAVKLINIVRGGYVKPPEGRAAHLIQTYFRLFGRDVDPWKWYFEAKEGIDEVVPVLKTEDQS